MPTVEDLRAAALAYASAGIKVFPVRAGAKEPATAHGVKDATTDEVQIQAWWAAVPYNIGIACGPESGVFVIDVDPRNGGEWTSPVATARARSGGGGDHWYFRWPQGVARMRKTLKGGVDVQGEGKYVLAPPSRTADDYVWLDAVQPAEAPPELLAEVAIAEGAVTDERPGDRFNRTHTWPEILEPMGWAVSHEIGDVVYWTRPGKTEGVSATTNYEGSDLFYVFSTSTEFESERGYDKFGVYAILYHGGDVTAAAQALAGEQPRLAAVGPATIASVPTVAPNTPSPAAASPLGGGGRRGSYTFEPAVTADSLVGEFMAYCASVTDAAYDYTEAAALSLLAVLTDGMRVQLAHMPDGLRTNLYVALVGSSSVSRKSTVQQIAVSFIKALRPNALVADRMTSEAAITELGQRSVALWAPDELGLLVTEMYQRGGFLAALEQLLLTIYSGQEYRYQTLGGGEHVVSGLGFSILGASTPESFASAGNRAIGSGLLPRFGLVFPAVPAPSRPPVATSEAHHAARATIEARFRKVLEMCMAPGGSRDVAMTSQALATLASHDSLFGASPLTARLVTASYKIAALLALSDLRHEVTEADAQAALVITRRWAEGARRLKQFLGRPAADIQAMEQVENARGELRQLVFGRALGSDGRVALSLREVARTLNLPASTLRRIRDTLAATGEVVVVVENNDEEWHVA